MRIELDLTEGDKKKLEFTSKSTQGFRTSYFYRKVQNAYLKAKNEIQKGDLMVEYYGDTVGFGVAHHQTDGRWVTEERKHFENPRKATPEEEKIIRPLLEGKK